MGKDQKPASARPIADEETGRNVDLHYSASHIAKLKEMKRAGKRIKLPPGVSIDDAPVAAPRSSDSTDGTSR